MEIFYNTWSSSKHTCGQKTKLGGFTGASASNNTKVQGCSDVTVETLRNKNTRGALGVQRADTENSTK